MTWTDLTDTTSPLMSIIVPNIRLLKADMCRDLSLFDLIPCTPNHSWFGHLEYNIFVYLSFRNVRGWDAGPLILIRRRHDPIKMTTSFGDAGPLILIRRRHDPIKMTPSFGGNLDPSFHDPWEIGWRKIPHCWNRSWHMTRVAVTHFAEEKKMADANWS
jgi:hypothetical protein